MTPNGDLISVDVTITEHFVPPQRASYWAAWAVAPKFTIPTVIKRLIAPVHPRLIVMRWLAVLFMGLAD
jgi:hypothetical protein